MGATMREVASLAGVSVKTVSRVVNGHPNISDDVLVRVRAAIEELDWRPNPHARSLRTGRTDQIALVLPELTSPRYANLAQAVVLEAERHGLSVSIEPTQGRIARARQVLDSLGSSIDAVVHVGPPAGEIAQAGAGRPVVAVLTGLDAAAVEALGWDAVDPDEDAAAVAVAGHLRALGRSQVAVLAHAADVPDLYVESLLALVPGATVLRGPITAERRAGRALMEELLAVAKDVDTVLCADDELAIGALSLLRERGERVPEHWAVVGHGDLEDGRFTTPSLTTTDLGVGEIARAAVDVVRSRRDDERVAPRRRLVPVRLQRRESTLGTAVGGAAGRGIAWAG